MGRATLFDSYVRRLRFEAQITAVETAKLIGQAMGRAKTTSSQPKKGSWTPSTEQLSVILARGF